MNATNVIDTVLNSVDAMGLNAVGAMYTALASDLQAVFATMMILYVAYWGMEIMFGSASMTAGQLMFRVIRMMAIYTIAFNWATFQTLVVNSLTDIANSVGVAVCSSVMSQNIEGGGAGSCSATQGLSNVLTAGVSAASQISAAGGWSGWGLWLIALLLILVVVIFAALALAMIIISKIVLMILLGLGPLMIAAALFQFSSVVFTGWMRQMAQYTILQILIYGLLGFVVMLTQASTTAIANSVSAGAGAIPLTIIVPFILMVIACAFVIKESVAISAGIVGGARLHWLGPTGGQMVGSTKSLLARTARFGVGAMSLRPSQNATMAAGTNTMSAGQGQVAAALKRNQE